MCFASTGFDTTLTQPLSTNTSSQHIETDHPKRSILKQDWNIPVSKNQSSSSQWIRPDQQETSVGGRSRDQDRIGENNSASSLGCSSPAVTYSRSSQPSPAPALISLPTTLQGVGT